MVEKICPECGAKFVLTYSNQACCSDECKRNRLRMQRRESKRCNARIRKLSPHQRMLANLRRRDALCPKPKTEIIERNGIIFERCGTVPAGAHAMGVIKHT